MNTRMAIILVLVLVTLACTGRSTPRFQTLPTPTTPPDFVSYSDELDIFSIEYPPDWRLNLSFMRKFRQGIKDLLLGKRSELPFDNPGLLFIGNGPNELIFTNVAVKPTKGGVDEIYEEFSRATKEASQSWVDLGVTRMDVGGRAAILAEGRYDLSDLGRGQTGFFHATALMLVQGKFAWIVGCGFPEEAAFDETCESIVRSFKITLDEGKLAKLDLSGSTPPPKTPPTIPPTRPTPYISPTPGTASFEFQYVCVDRILVPCQIIQEFLDAVYSRTNGEVKIHLSSYADRRITGATMIQNLGEGAIGAGEIHGGFLVGGAFPIFETANLWGTYDSTDQWYEAVEALQSELISFVRNLTNGGEVVGFNYYPDNYYFAKNPIKTNADFKGAIIGATIASRSLESSAIFRAFGAQPTFTTAARHLPRAGTWPHRRHLRLQLLCLGSETFRGN